MLKVDIDKKLWTVHSYILILSIALCLVDIHIFILSYDNRKSNGRTQPSDSIQSKHCI